MVDLVLTGYRGSGKTTVGRLLAERRRCTFIDTDERIVIEAGRTIAEIFAAEGEAGFRRREGQVLAAVAQEKGRCVLSVGGGAVESPANRAVLRSLGLVVWLDAPAEALWPRIQADPATAANRPNLAGGGLDEVHRILARRRPWYAEIAGLVVSVADRTPEEVAAVIQSFADTGRDGSGSAIGSEG